MQAGGRVSVGVERVEPNAVESKTENLILALIMSVGFVAVLSLFFLAFRYPSSQIPMHVLRFRFNTYALLSLLGILCNGSLLVYINLPKLRTPEAPWFSLYLAMNVIWSFGEMATRLSTTPAGAIFWWHFEAVGLGFAPCAFFLFAMAYAYQDSFVRHVLPVITMVSLGLLVEYLFLATSVLVDKNPAHAALTPWGYYPAYPATYSPILIWLLAGYVGAQIMLVRHFRNTKDWNKVKLFIFGSLIPLIIGMITDGVLPVFGVIFPPSAVIATAIFASIVAFVMLRYGLLRLNPRMFAPGLLQTMNEGVIVTDPGLRVEFFNNHAMKLLSTDDTSMLREKNLFDLFSAEQGRLFRLRVIDQLQKRDFAQYEDVQIQAVHGTNIPVSIAAAKVLDGQNRLTGYSFVLTDLRRIKAAEYQLELEKKSVERKVALRTMELRRAQGELEASIRSLPFGVAIITSNDEITFSNDKFSTLLGYTVPTNPADSTQVLRQISGEYKSAIDILDCLHDSQAHAKQIEQNISFGPRFFRFFFTPVFGSDTHTDAVIGGVLLVEDTTDAKALERSRDEFFSIASHELRTPLTAIRGNTSMILTYFQEQLSNPELREMLVDIHNSSTRLISIVNDFLDMSRLEQGKFVFKMQSFDIRQEVIEPLVREYQENASKRGLYLKLEMAGKSPHVRADIDRTRQILVNLLSNALKFTDKGGITLAVAKEDDIVRVSVIDTGQGIPIDSQHLLFRKFQQASNNILTRDNTQSTGLGLYISKLLAEKMGGRLYIARTQAGAGSTFSLEVPAAPVSNNASR